APNRRALRGGVEPASLAHDPRLEELFVEPLVLRHSLWRRGSRRLGLLAFLCHYQHSHRCLLLSQLPHRYWARAFEASPTHRMRGGLFDIHSSLKVQTDNQQPQAERSFTKK